jgi:ribonuclease P protein component
VENQQRYFFGKEDKLKSRKSIQLLFKSGQRFSFSSYKVIWMLSPGHEGCKTGVGASSRYFKKAVDRNRIKRLMRESYRLQKSRLDQYVTEKNLGLDVFIIYNGNNVPSYGLVFEKTGMIIERLIKAINEKNPAHT